MNQCIAFGLAKSFQITELKAHLANQHDVSIYREVLHYKLGADDHVFIFPYGVMVCWGLIDSQRQASVAELQPFLIDPLTSAVEDEFDYSAGSSKVRLNEDHIYLSEQSPQEMLALSHGIAQSVKLAELEIYAGRTVEETAYIPRNMAETGSTQLSRRDIARMRGKLFLVESDINHHYALLDTPEYFWEYPELEGLYLEAARYLDVQARVEVLNKKLEMIHKLFGMLADEQNHKHSSLLEWIIIWLIAVEIVIFLGHDLLKIF